MRTSSRHRLRVHLFHDARPMDLHGARTDAQILRNGLVLLALGHEIEHFAFARRERLEVRLDARMLAERLAQLAVLDDGALDAIQQVLVAERFLQEIEGAVLHGLDGHRDVAMARHEDHRDHRAAQVELLLQFQAAHAGHADVEHQAAGLRGLIGGEKFLRRRVLGAFEPHGLEQRAHGVAHAGVVVHHHDEGILLHVRASSATGSRTKKTAPCGSAGRVPIVPPCDCTMVRLMARPSPVPDPLVVQNGSNSLSATLSDRCRDHCR